jgi:hypothetical protein
VRPARGDGHRLAPRTTAGGSCRLGPSRGQLSPRGRWATLAGCGRPSAAGSGGGREEEAWVSGRGVRVRDGRREGPVRIGRRMAGRSAAWFLVRPYDGKGTTQGGRGPDRARTRALPRGTATSLCRSPRNPHVPGVSWRSQPARTATRRPGRTSDGRHGRGSRRPQATLPARTPRHRRFGQIPNRAPAARSRGVRRSLRRRVASPSRGSTRRPTAGAGPCGSSTASSSPRSTRRGPR